jgi:hypothetical protein
MGLPLHDPRACYEKLKFHMGHNIVVVGYGDKHDPNNVAIECNDCCEVLLDFNHPDHPDHQDND